MIIQLRDVALVPQPNMKWLGVTIDSKLTFTTHIRFQAAKVLNTANMLARTGWGIPFALCKRLTACLIFTRTDYACIVWHNTTSSPLETAALQRVDKIAHRFALGSFKSQPTEFLLHNTKYLKAREQLTCKSDAAIGRLLTLPLSNPAGSLVAQELAQH